MNVYFHIFSKDAQVGKAAELHSTFCGISSVGAQALPCYKPRPLLCEIMAFRLCVARETPFYKAGFGSIQTAVLRQNESAFGLCLKTPSPEQHQAWVRHSLMDYLIKITVDGEHMNMWALWLPWKIKQSSELIKHQNDKRNRNLTGNP